MKDNMMIGNTEQTLFTCWVWLLGSRRLGPQTKPAVTVKQQETLNMSSRKLCQPPQRQIPCHQTGTSSSNTPPVHPAVFSGLVRLGVGGTQQVKPSVHYETL